MTKSSKEDWSVMIVNTVQMESDIVLDVTTKIFNEELIGWEDEDIEREVEEIYETIRRYQIKDCLERQKIELENRIELLSMLEPILVELEEELFEIEDTIPITNGRF